LPYNTVTCPTIGATTY